MNSHGDRIAQLRKKRKWEQADLAEKLGVGQSTVSNWEKGGVIKSDDLYGLAKVFDVSTDFILTGKAPMQVTAVSDDDVPNAIYKDLVEANSDYRLVPKTILQEEYRIMLKSEIDQRQQLFKEVIEAKNVLIEQLKGEIGDLRSRLT